MHLEGLATDGDGDPEDLGKFRGKCNIVSNEALSLMRIRGLRAEYNSSTKRASYGIVWPEDKFLPVYRPIF